MSPLLHFALPATAVLVAASWWLGSLVQALRTSDATWAAAGQSKVLYVVLMLVTGVLGVALYWTIARPALGENGPRADGTSVRTASTVAGILVILTVSQTPFMPVWITAVLWLTSLVLVGLLTRTFSRTVGDRVQSRV